MKNVYGMLSAFGNSFEVAHMGQEEELCDAKSQIVTIG